MIGKIHPGLLIAGGIGAAGVGFLMFKGKGEKAEEGAATDPAASGADPAATTPTATTMPGSATPGMPGAVAPGLAGASPFLDAGSVASSGMPATGPTAGAGAGAGTGAGQLQGEQVGPYTIVQDASGVDLVFETATQQPVGVLDAQGNLTPVTVGPDGSIALAQEQPTASAIGPAPHPGAGAATGTTMSAPATESDAVYARMAAELFAGPSTAAVGAATVSPQALAAAGTVMPSAGGQALAGAGQVGAEQVGEFTLVGDPAGTREVYDTATRQLLGVIDAAGNVTPTGGSATGTTGPATPAAMGASVPEMSQGTLPAMAG